MYVRNSELSAHQRDLLVKYFDLLEQITPLQAKLDEIKAQLIPNYLDPYHASSRRHAIDGAHLPIIVTSSSGKTVVLTAISEGKTLQWSPIKGSAAPVEFKG